MDLPIKFRIRQKWFNGLRLLVDLGYLGIDKHYEIKDLYIGIKKKRSKKGEPPSKLSDNDKGVGKK